MASDQTDNSIPVGFRLADTRANDNVYITQIAWSPDGQRLAFSSGDGTITLWNPEMGVFYRANLSTPARCVGWSPDSKVVASGGTGGEISLFNTEGQKVGGILTGSSTAATSVAWSPDGKMLASTFIGSSKISLWSIEPEDPSRTTQAYTLSDELEPPFTSVVWGDSTLLAAARADGSVYLWDVPAIKVLQKFQLHASAVNSVAFSPNRPTIASASNDLSVVVLEDETRRVSRLEHEHPVTCVSFSFDGLLLASISNDGTLKLWRTDTWALVASLKEPRRFFRSFYATQIAFRPRMPLLAALGENDTLIRVWELDYELLLKSASAQDEVKEEQGQVSISAPAETIELEEEVKPTLPAETVTPVLQTTTAELDRTEEAMAADAARVEETTPTAQETPPATQAPIVGAAQTTETTATTEPTHEEQRVPTAKDAEQQVNEDKPGEKAEQKSEQKLGPPPERKSETETPHGPSPTPEPQPSPAPLPQPEPPPEELNLPGEKFFPSASGDQPTSEDSIGFTPYVNAIAEFLSNEKTKAPLTLSIEGEWGSGKSSFMLQLEKELLNRVAPRKRHMLWRVRREMRIRAERIPAPLRRLKSFQLRLRWKQTEIKFPQKRIKFFQRLTVPKEVRKVTCPTVRFNAWRHDKEDALWASFAIAFIRKLSKGLPLHRRVLAYFKLLFRRFRWSDGLPVLLRALTLSAVFVLTTAALVSLMSKGGVESLVEAVGGKITAEGAFATLIRGSGLVGYIAVFFFLANKFKDFIGNPLSVDLKRYVEAPDYRSHVAFIENFHEDFKRIVDAYAGENKVFIFIDDLDRCEVPKAADLMQALNLLISDSPQLIFIIGMDREKVAAGLAVKYEKLLPYLAQPPATDGAAKATAAAAPAFDASGGLEYGYSYIEKFIQLPFSIPQPDRSELERLLAAISPPPKTADGNGSLTRAASKSEPLQVAVPSADIRKDKGDESPAPATQTVVAPMDGLRTWSRIRDWVIESPQTTAQSAGQTENREADGQGSNIVKETVDGDSEAVRETALMVASAFENNPRRIKQFINSFRLKAYIVDNLNLLVPYGKAPTPGRMTLQQLGKFVAISLRWPRLLADLDDDRNLLVKLQRLALNESAEAKAVSNATRIDLAALPIMLYGLDGVEMTTEERRDAVVEQWGKRQALMVLLRRDCDADKRKLCSLETLEVDNLLKISPKRSTPTLPSSKAGTAA